MRATPDELRPACSRFPFPAGGLTVLVLGWLIGASPLAAQLVIDSNTSSYSNSNYSGTITVRGATLSLATGNALGNSAIVEVESDGILDITSEAEKFGNLSGNGTVLLGSSQLEIMANSQDSSFSGALDGSGTFLISTDASADDTFTLGTEKISTGYTSDSYAYTGTFNIADADASLALYTTGTVDRLTNTFIGPGDLRKTGTGTLTFGDDQASVTAMLSGHTGALEIAEGILALDTSDGSYALSHDYLKGAGTLGIKGSDGNSNAVTLSGDWDAFGDFTGNIHIFQHGRFIVGADDSLGDDNAVQVDDGGLLQLAAAEGFGSLSGSGEVKFGSSALLVGADDEDAVFAGELSGSADVTKNGGGTWTLGDGARSPSAVLSGHSGNLIVAAGTVAFDTSKAADELDHVVTGAGGIAKVGGNSLTLSATNTFTGGTTIGAGTVSISQAANLGAATSDLTFDGGALAVTASVTLGSGRAVTVTVNHGTVDTGSHTLAINGVISGATGTQLTKTGSGTLFIDATNTFAGTFDVNAGTFAIGTGNTLSADATVDLAPGTTLDLTAEDEDFGALTGSGDVLLGSSTIGVGYNDADANFAGVIAGSGGLTKAGEGTLTLTAANTYTGPTAITGGTLALDGGDERIANTSVVSVSSGATFALGTSTETIGGLSGSGTVDFGSSSLTVEVPTGASSSFGGNFTRASGSHFYKSGDGTQYITSDIFGIGGNTVIEGGTLSLGNGGGAGFLSSYIEINAAGNLTFDQSRNLSLGTGWLSGTGTLTKEGSGNLTLSGSTGHTGPVIINDGTVTLNSRTAIESVSPVTVNSGGILQLNGQSVELASLDGDGAILFSDNVNDFYRDSYVLPLKLTVGGNNADSVFTGGIASKYWTYSDGSTFEVVNSGTFEKIGTGTLEIDTEEFGATLINIEAGTLKLGTGNVLENDQRVSLSSGATLDITAEGESFGGLEGTGGMVRMGASNLSVGADNTTRTYAGGLNNFTDANDDTLAGSPGDLIKTGTQLFTIEGDLATNLANFTGDFEIQGGGLALSPSSGVTYTLAASRLIGSGNLRQSGEGTLTLAGAPSAFTGDFVLNPSSTLDFDLDSALTVAIATDRLSGSGVLRKSGDGTLTLDGDGSNFTGNIQVAGGTLETGGGGNSLGNETSIDLVSGTSLVLTGGELLGGVTGAGGIDFAGYDLGVGYNNASSATFTGSFTSSGGGGETFTKAGSGTFTLGTSGLSNYAGTFVLEAGDFEFLTTTGTTDLVNNAITGSASAGLTKVGDGTLVLTGTNAYTGRTQLNAGTLKLGSAGAIGSTGGISFAGGTLQYGSTNQTDYSARFTQAADEDSYRIDTNGQNVTFATGLGSKSSFSKLGAGTLTLTGDNSFSQAIVETGTLVLTGTNSNWSATTVAESAILQIGNGGSTGTFADHLTNHGSLVLHRSGTLSLDGDITGTGSVIQQGPGTATLGGINDYSGGTTVNAGTLRIGKAAAIGTGSIDVQGGTLAFDASLTLDATRPLELNGGTLFITSGRTLTLTQALGGSGSLVKTGSGTLDIGATTQSVSGLTLSDGYLSGSGSLASSTGFTLQAGAVGPSLTGSSTLAKLGGGVVTLTGDNSYTGGTVLTAGTLQIGHANALGSSGTISFDGGTLRHSSANTVDYSSRFSQTAGQAYSIDTYGENITLANALTSAGGSLTKLGGGTLTLSADNTYTGTTTISAGTLQIGDGGTTGQIAGAISNAGTLIVDRRGELTLAGGITGTGSLEKRGDGSLVLTADNDYTGSTTVAAGNLVFTTRNAFYSGSINSSNAGKLTVAAGATATFLTSDDNSRSRADRLGTIIDHANVAAGAFIGIDTSEDADGSFTLNQNVGGDLGLRKLGSGTLNLAGTNTYSGSTAIDVGRLNLSGSAANSTFIINDGGTLSGTGTLGALTLNDGGILSPGNSPGTLGASDTVWNGGGEFVFEINDASGVVGTSWDLLDLTGSLTINATSGNPFTINIDTLTAGNLVGEVDNFDANTNYSWTFVQTSGGITFGSGASIGGSFSLDTSGFANATNGTFAVAQVGNNLALTYTSLSAVPEPSTTALLLGLGIFGFVIHRRRRAPPTGPASAQ